MDSTLARIPRAVHLFIMEITLTTPAILFPAVSLLMLAYTNRFLAIASIIRVLHRRYKADGSVVVRR